MIRRSRRTQTCWVGTHVILNFVHMPIRCIVVLKSSFRCFNFLQVLTLHWRRVPSTLSTHRICSPQEPACGRRTEEWRINECQAFNHLYNLIRTPICFFFQGQDISHLFVLPERSLPNLCACIAETGLEFPHMGPEWSRPLRASLHKRRTPATSLATCSRCRPR
jgi:hypothetical protein